MPKSVVRSSKDQPPAGTPIGRPTKSRRMTSRRRCNSVTYVGKVSYDRSSAVAAASCAMPTGTTTLARETATRSGRSASGATVQPTRQPIMRSSLEALPTVIVRSAMPGSPAGWMTSRPSNNRRSIAASRISVRLWVTHRSATVRQSSASRTAPEGMDGDISSTMLVFGPMAARSASRSSVQVSPGRKRNGTKRGTPPARWTRLMSPA